MKRTVTFHTLGCRLNMAETGTLAFEFSKKGFEVCEYHQDLVADIYVLNTCTVTDGADATCRNIIRKFHRQNPQGLIFVIGCYAQVASEDLVKIEGVAMVLGTSEKYKIFEYLEQIQNQVADGHVASPIINVTRSRHFWPAKTSPMDKHTRAFLKIQDGCNYACSYCIIPFARGASCANGIKAVVEDVEMLVSNGYKEIVLTGVNIGEYETNTGESFTDCLKAVLSVPGLMRLRLSSIEPNTITDDLLEVMKSHPAFLPYFHLPLQSGDDEILVKMRRKYTCAEYAATVMKIKNIYPDACIGADVILGFPGESDAHFENTFNFISSLPLTHLHVFPYSKRAHTIAAKLPDHVPADVKKKRVKELTQLGHTKQTEFAQKMVGQKAQVLFEVGDESGGFEGYTENFLRVRKETKGDDANLRNQLLEVTLKEWKDDHFIAD